MAALSCECGKISGKFCYLSRFASRLGCKETTYISSILQKRSYSAPKADESLKQGGRKKRDKLTVLRALASTVEHVPNRPDYRFVDDSVLNPRSLMKQKELFLSIESGTKAAEYVLEKYPDLFPLREPVPAWPKQVAITNDMEVSVENMQLLMRSEENISKVVDWYQKLDSEGKISMEDHNDMLDFASFHAIPGVSQSSAESESDDSLDENDKTSNSKWREDCFAEKLFGELKDKGNARTYEVFILGLLKHEKIFRAFQIYQELVEKNLQGTSRYLYNTLLSHVCQATKEDKERWDLAKDIVGGMKRNGMKPDVDTFNSLLAIAVEKKEEADVLCQQLIREMKMLDIAPTLGSYYYVLAAEKVKSIQDISVLYAIVRELKKGAVQFELRHPADMMLFHSCMDFARFKRHSHLAKEVLDIVLKHGLKYLLGFRASSFFGNYICAIARTAEDIDYVLEEYRKLVPKYFIPRDWVMQQLFYAMRNNRDPKRLPELYSDMVSLRVPFTDKGAKALFEAMLVNIPKERAEEFLYVVTDAEKWIDVFEIKKTPEMMSVSITVSALCGLHEQVKEKLEECNRLQITPSVDAMRIVLESNIDSGDKEGALRTLKSMVNFGMRLTHDVDQMIAGADILSDKRDKILSWFAES